MDLASPLCDILLNPISSHYPIFLYYKVHYIIFIFIIIIYYCFYYYLFNQQKQRSYILRYGSRAFFFFFLPFCCTKNSTNVMGLLLQSPLLNLPDLLMHQILWIHIRCTENLWVRCQLKRESEFNSIWVFVDTKRSATSLWINMDTSKQPKKR